ncbi:MAG: hypothetical protein R3D00_20075 [Bacteroidia bacterium]
MNRFYKTLILCLFFFGSTSLFAATFSLALPVPNPEISLQDKPKAKDEKIENTDSPLTMMFRELLGYIYTPAISPTGKTEKMASSEKEIQLPKEDKKLPAN